MIKRNISKIWFLFLAISFLASIFFLALTFKNNKFTTEWAIIDFFRLPEVIVLLVGTIGAVIATYVIHIITKNKIADISIIGINSINIFMITIIYGLTSVTLFQTIREYVMPFIYFGASFGVMIIIYILTYRFKESSTKIVLLGIIVSLTVSAFSSLYLSSLPHNKQSFISTLSVGSISTGLNIMYSSKMIISYAMLLASLIILIVFYKQIKIVYTDPEKAITLGVKIKFIRFILFLIVSLSATASFLCLGSIAFIGFVSTNIVYLFFKKIGVFQILYTIIISLILMLIVYILKENIIPTGTPIGIITNIIAVPYFILILLKGGK